MEKVKRGGKALTGVLCFIFGFIFAVIVEVAAIAAGIYFLLNSDIDDLLSTVGVENTDDEGNKIYINTNLDELTTVQDLISVIGGLASDFDVNTTTLNDLDEYFPAVGLAVDKVYDTVAGVLTDYMTEEELAEIFDRDELMNTPLAGLSDYAYNSMLKANVEIVFDIAGLEVESNSLYMAIAYGAQATVGTFNGETVALSLETFTKTETGEGTEEGTEEIASYSLSGDIYTREDGTVLGSAYSDYVVEDNGTYALYCYVTEDAEGEAVAYIAERGEDGSFTVTTDVYEDYSSANVTISGAYWYDGGTLEVISRHTLGDFVGEDADVSAVFDDVYMSDIISGFIEEGENDLSDLFEGYTLGDFINGEVVIDSLMDRVYIADYLDVSADDAIMMYFGYAITDVEAAEEGARYGYTGIINFYQQNEDGEWTATEDKQTAYIVVGDDGYVAGVYTDEALTEEYEGVVVSEINALTGNFMDALYVKDVIDITDEDSKLLQKLGGYKLGELSAAMDEIMLSDVVEEVYTDDEIVAYMVYGITDITVDGTTGIGTATYHCLDEECGCEGTHVVTVDVDTEATSEGGYRYLITSVYYTTTETDDEGNEQQVKVEVGTNINDVSDRIDAMLDDLTLGEIIDITEGDTILWALRNSTINSLAGDVADLTVQELFADEIYGGTGDNDETIEATLYEVVESESGVTDDSTQIAFNSAYLYYYYDENGDEYVFIGHLDSYTEEYDLYTYGVPQGVWKLLLYTTKDGESYEEPVKINEAADMQSNVLTNLQNSTLNDLYEMGILVDNDEGTLEKLLETPYDEDRTIGDLTISEYMIASADSFGSGN